MDWRHEQQRDLNRQEYENHLGWVINKIDTLNYRIKAREPLQLDIEIWNRFLNLRSTNKSPPPSCPLSYDWDEPIPYYYLHSYLPIKRDHSLAEEEIIVKNKYLGIKKDIEGCLSQRGSPIELPYWVIEDLRLADKRMEKIERTHRFTPGEREMNDLSEWFSEDLNIK